jgi:hypothetical protein
MTARVDNERREQFARTRTSLALWFGVLGGPIAGLCNVMIDYPAVDRACVNDSSLLLHVLTLFFLVVAIVAGFTAWSFRERVGHWPATAGGMLPRSRFMGTLGILTATVAVFGIILQWIPIFFLGACHGT